MGLYDRDYMRNRHRESSYVRRSVSRITPRRSWSTWWVALAMIGALVLLAVLSKRHREYASSLPALPTVPTVLTVPTAPAVSAEPFPATGEVRWYVSPPEKDGAKDGAPLSIAAPAEGNRNYVVRLNEWNGDGLVAIIPIRGGETAQVVVPLGRYRITIASGKSWQGPEKLFGFTGEVKVAVDPMDFYRTGNKTMGNTIDLRSRINGNMQTRPQGLFDK